MSVSHRDFVSPGKGCWASVSDRDWNDWHWQLKNRIHSLDQIKKLLFLSPEERRGLMFAAKEKLAFSLTPYFFNLIDPHNPNCPIRRQVIPRSEELVSMSYEMMDPCGEDKDMVAPGLVHRYPDRVLLLVTDRCASYCRYCTRSRIVSGVGGQKLETDDKLPFDYLKNHPEIRDVLISGGDPLLLSDARLERILRQLREIPHIEIVRIGSRIPIFLPQRITDNLCKILKTYHPLWLNIHSNHPKELTLEAKTALEKLADAGIPLGNQSVLLKGVNDDHQVILELVTKLIRCRVRPYYLYQCDLIQGTHHFRVPIKRGLEIMQRLRGFTTGFAVPQYVVDGPGGGGKIPLNPDYVIGYYEDKVLLRNYEGKIFSYPVGQNNAKGEENYDRQSEAGV
ncbi:KamA family radical SAM protein [Methylacidiphilum caldifontis]|uniref:L-lysine 2,3-aminomutase n=1 Tax=Methylacidiphilum caldifontis TaxID=2795386 RepID=A0A4Y8PDL2_9BACT|nr:KamA family radical SAM protein [Methylacidiphilum caldifontis]TFE69582.1 lysine 2,3-aminomutase [Methylacidiphilum caldifontis]